MLDAHVREDERGGQGIIDRSSPSVMAARGPGPFASVVQSRVSLFPNHSQA